MLRKQTRSVTSRSLSKGNIRDAGPGYTTQLHEYIDRGQIHLCTRWNPVLDQTVRYSGSLVRDLTYCIDGTKVTVLRRSGNGVPLFAFLAGEPTVSRFLSERTHQMNNLGVVTIQSMLLYHRPSQLITSKFQETCTTRTK